MEGAFKASADRIRPSLTDDDYLAIRKHLCTAYVLSGNYGRDDAAEQAQRMMYAAQVLLDAGGIAVKCESSGIAHSKARWGELVARVAEAARMPGDDVPARYALYRPLYEALVRFMTEGPVVVAALERADAVAHLRRTMGATDSRKAEAGTIRNLYGTDIERNAIHGSDSAENAAKEIAFFFGEAELL